MEYKQITPGPLSPLADQFMVRMRDGVRLATDVYLPAGDASAGDTILIRLPYDKNGDYTFIPLVAEHMLRRGYRVVAQDVRGKFRSEGDTLLVIHEANDGYDTIEWVTQQAWSNGRVAMWGESYFGFTQWAAASTGHPALKAIAPRLTGTQLCEPVDTERAGPVQGVDWTFLYTYPTTFFQSNDTFQWKMDWASRPYVDQFEDFFATVGHRSPSFDQWYPRPVHLRRFPEGTPFDAPAIPVLQTIGWWDNSAPLSWSDFREIRRRPAWALTHYLRIEPIDHEGYSLLDSDEIRAPENKHAHLTQWIRMAVDPALDFFEVFVRGNGSPTDIPRVSWNLGGTVGMRESESWPPSGVQSRTLFATLDRGLVEDSPGAVEELTWIHDAADAVPSSSADPFAFLLTRPDESGLGDREDVLVFTSEPAADDVDLVGAVSVCATVRSSGPSMDLFVRLFDVDHEGSAFRIARGQVRIVDASTAVEVEVDLDHLGYRLRRGHRLRLHVSSSDFPEYVPLVGDGSDPWSATHAVPNTQRILIGGQSALALSYHVLGSKE